MSLKPARWTIGRSAMGTADAQASTKSQLASNLAIASRSRSRHRFIGHSFDVVPIGIKNKAGIVVHSVLWARAGCTIVCATRAKSSSMKRLDLCLAIYPESDVQMRQRQLAVRTLKSRTSCCRQRQKPKTRRPFQRKGDTPKAQEPFRRRVCSSADRSLQWLCDQSRCAHSMTPTLQMKLASAAGYEK